MMERTIKENMTPRECLQLVLDNVDYKAKNCSPTDMVGAVLPSQIIDIARKSLEQKIK